MKRGASFTVEGLSELDAKLGELPAAAAKGVLRRTARKALVPFDQAWRENVHVLTGRLQKSGGIGSKLSKGQRKEIEREATIEVFAGPGPDPAALQDEFGNSHQAALPAVRPAWDATKDQALAIVKAELGGEIMKSAGRVQRAAARKAAKAAAGEG